MNTFSKSNWFYISGPMTGKPDLNRQAFGEAAARIKSLGGVVLHNPANVDSDLPYSEMMAISVLMLTRCTDVMLLPGYLDSKGAMTEYNSAASMGKRFHIYRDHIDATSRRHDGSKDSTPLGYTPHFPCRVCGAMFEAMHDLNTHISTKHQS